MANATRLPCTQPRDRPGIICVPPLAEAFPHRHNLDAAAPLRTPRSTAPPPIPQGLKMKRSILSGIDETFWLFFWAIDTGVLVASWQEGYPNSDRYRVCHYLIGL